MQFSRTALVIIASAMTAAAAPALAGNYAEGDPRPKAAASQTSVSDVSGQTRQWMATAPTVGYPEGNPRAVVQTGQKTRAQVQAEAVAWVASGMSQVAYSNASKDSMGPSYKRAEQEFARLRGQGGSVASQ
ncbi:MAG: hypothetical protein J0I65_09060 [Variovorax sp.]|nr:hypothetical protein [Variovorax sp.]